eukprot:TRINITY_DN1422_c0_g1_i2.p1 TRINITY_DN1422_c0_g1~~TRINITY_DN1422_c0_g1_i2.p1  ORF type:complete len:191 (-),score=22.32 TRINITY_DN1422_c0_g1_i2:111-626(-)
MENETRKCFVCGTLTTKVCSRCKMLPYCSRECQVSNWKEHKETLCPQLQQHNVQVQYTKMMAFVRAIEMILGQKPVVLNIDSEHPEDQRERFDAAAKSVKGMREYLVTSHFGRMEILFWPAEDVQFQFPDDNSLKIGATGNKKMIDKIGEVIQKLERELLNSGGEPKENLD